MDAGPLTPGVLMKYRLYHLAVTFAMLAVVVGGLVGTNGAKWG
jgi:hypothetical protein